MKKFFLNFFFISIISAQNVDINNSYIYQEYRINSLKSDSLNDYSFNIRPITLQNNSFNNYYKTIFKKKNLLIKNLGVDYHIEFNSNHPYNRNNGTMLPNRGYQHIVSPGLYFELGPLSIQFKPEHHYSQNKKFEGWWEGHYPEVWSSRYRLWNHIDMPERHGEKRHNKTTFGQSSLRLNWNKLSIGLSSENIWWGPSLRNSIMMSNHAQGFKHITFNTIKPISTFIGKFEWQLITGRLESSGYAPPGSDYEYAGTKLYVIKRNQRGEVDDWRFLQGLIVSYSPKWVEGLSIGFIRWVQMYSALIEGKYPWLQGNPSYFPVFKNLFRKNDEFENYEQQTNQAAGIFLKWNWKDSNAEIYFEFHHNDSKQNLRDLILDSDHSRAATLGIQKIFNINDNDFLFNWEWTQMEQTAGRLLRNAASWYEHVYVYDGYTNRGEVLGSSIGPGSNSHYLSINKLNKSGNIGLFFEIIDHDNDFYYEAFESAQDYRRYWKDLNFGINYNRKFNNFILSGVFAYIRSMNYQWQLDDLIEPYYHKGRDLDNFHLNLKLTYFGLNGLFK